MSSDVEKIAAAAGGSLVPQNELDDFARLWRIAEARVKRTELIRGALTVPAVNELRYAGYHLLEALVARVPAKALEEVAKAKKHAKRAAFDACEAEILFRCEQIKKFKDDYRTVEVNVPGFDFIAVQRAFREAQNALIFNTEAQRANRDEHYELALQYCDPLKVAVETAEDARVELNKRLADKAERDRVDRRRWRIGISVAAIGAVAAIVGAYLTVRMASPPTSTASVAQAQDKGASAGDPPPDAAKLRGTPAPAGAPNPGATASSLQK